MPDPLYKPDERIPGTVYRVVKHLATGGMGTVYDVEDVSVGKRYVLKTLNPDLLERADLQKRMEAEGRILGRLQHPNIVEVVTAGQTQDAWNLPYFVMERLSGQNLRSILDKTGQLQLTQAVRIAIDLLDALDHAHDHNVVHRDVKPENIFLHKGVTGATTTKLLDFGIMRLVDAGRVENRAGRFVGTVRYAAPEQIAGTELSPKVDLYAAALVLYEMLVGTGPFDHLETASQLGAAHVKMEPPPLSKRIVVPESLERVVMQGLAKEPNQRHKDAFTFAAELRRFLRSQESPDITRDTPSSLVNATADGGALVPTSESGMAAASIDPPRSQRTVADGWASTHVDRDAATRTFDPGDAGGDRQGRVARGEGGDTEALAAIDPPSTRDVQTPSALSASAAPTPPPRTAAEPRRIATRVAAAVVAGLAIATVIAVRERIGWFTAPTSPPLAATSPLTEPAPSAPLNPPIATTATAFPASDTSAIATTVVAPSAAAAIGTGAPMVASARASASGATSAPSPTPRASTSAKPAGPAAAKAPRPVASGSTPRFTLD